MELIDPLNNNDIAWPPPYILRLSKRAKRIYLKILPKQGLEVVVPFRRHNQALINELLDEKRDWIEKHLAQVKIPVLEHVKELHLRAIEQTWHIEYKQTLSQRLRSCVSIGEKHNTLTLYGNVNDVSKTHAWLQKWLREIAVKHLEPWIRRLSAEHQLLFNELIIRGQQTLWGSCNHAKRISLNYKLLFIPANYAQHIMLHELCHTRHLNHSQRFWNLLAKLDPDCEHHNNMMRHGDQFIPDWI